ncbi:MAG: pectinesterase family protein [Clostridia bacterium]|nr:pectinesterase family protein [Clostridia bacterium]
MRDYSRKILSIVLSLAMLISNLSFAGLTSVTALAEENDAIEINAYTEEQDLDKTEEGKTYSVASANDEEPVDEAENFELWLDDEAVDGVVSTGVRTYGGSTLQLNGASSNGEEVQFTIARSEYQNIVRAGKTVNAYQAGARYGTPNDIAVIPKAGEGSCVVFTPAATGMFNAYVYTTRTMRVWDFDTASGERIIHDNAWYIEAAAGESPLEFAAFKAEAGHTYVLSTTGSTSNLGYAGFEYIVDEPVTVSLTDWTEDGKYNYDNVEVTLTDAYLGTVAAVIKKGDTSIDLSKGHTYVLSTNDGGAKAAVNGSASFKVVDETPITISMEAITDVTLTGSFVGGDASTVKSVKFVNMVNGDEYSAVINGDTYTVDIKPGEYNTVIESSAYFTKDRVSVAEDSDNVNNIYLESLVKSKYVLPEEAAGSSALELNGITANNSTSVKGNAGSTIVIPVKGKQKITVAGWYAGTWDINGYNSVTADSSNSPSNPATNSYITDGTETTVTVNITGEGVNYLYWITVEDITEFKSEISVPGDFDTLTEAVAYIKNNENRPEGEEGRVTINLTADIQEQVVFDAPYITLNGNGHEITWYYGVGCKYYSLDENGLYNESLFYDSYSKNAVSAVLWGGVVIVRGDYFRAENASFRNTFNYEVTEKELLDGAECDGVYNMPERTADTDVQEYSCKERANALYIEADNLECYNCKILSSQDTLGRNGSADNGYRTYFRDCVIGGNVDYICGEFTAVFDNCELQWKSYTNDTSNNAKIGYIAVPKTSPYIFRNCRVTADKDADGVLGYYGRTWGDNSQAYFINTETNGLINEDGWNEMMEGQLSTSVFYEYNNTSKGTAFVSALGNQMTDENVISDMTSDNIISAYLGSWTPVYYDYMQENTTETTTEAPSVSVDGDMVKYPVDGGYMYFNMATGEITDCDVSVTKVVIPETILDVSVTGIGYGAFEGCVELTDIIIPESIESIDNYVFYNCGLNTVYCYKDSFADNIKLYPPSVVIKYLDYTVDRLFADSPKKAEINDINDGWNIIKENGAFYAQSSNTDNSSSSTLTITVNGPCVLYYEMAVSSEEGTDNLVMRNNGTKVKVISGTDTYTFDSPYTDCMVLGEGENVLTWKYSKDDEGSEGEDCAWIKNLRLADLGDNNLDGKIDITDAVLGQKYIADNDAITDILGRKAADCNIDGIVNRADTACILRQIIKNIA